MTATNARATGGIALAGALTMMLGAVFWGTSGTDLWAALRDDTLAAYLTDAAAVRARLVANLTLWIVGVLLIGTALRSMTRFAPERASTHAAQICITTAVPLAILSFLAMMVLVVRIAPDTSPGALALSESIGWIAARADDLATSLLVGLAPLFLAIAARGTWMPGWLAVWGYIAGAVGVFALVVLYVAPLAAFGFLIIPVGIGWMIAAGAILLRRPQRTEVKVPYDASSRA